MFSARTAVATRTHIPLDAGVLARVRCDSSAAGALTRWLLIASRIRRFFKHPAERCINRIPFIHAGYHLCFPWWALATRR